GVRVYHAWNFRVSIMSGRPTYCCADRKLVQCRGPTGWKPRVGRVCLMSSTSRSPRAASPKLAEEPGTNGFSFKRLDIAALLGLFAVTLAFFWPMIRPRDHWYIVSGDFSNQFFPFRTFAATEWWAGRIPLWNPDMLAGHPFLADVQTAIFYPPALLNA